MTKYTIDDVRHIIPEPLTGNQIKGVETYLNTGKIPPEDPCISCEPATIRKLISRIQVAVKNGEWRFDRG